MSNNVKSRIQMKADTAANWTTAGQNGFIPLKNEAIFYTDKNNMKLGDGVTNVNQLDFFIKSGDGAMKYMGEVNSLPVGLTAKDKGCTYKAAQALPGRALLEVNTPNYANSSGGSFETETFVVQNPGWIEVSLVSDDIEGPPHYFQYWFQGFYYDEDYGDYYSNTLYNIETKFMNEDASIVQFHITDEIFTQYEYFNMSISYTYDGMIPEYEGYVAEVSSYSIREVSTVKAGDLIIWTGSTWDVIPSGDDVMNITELKSEIIQEMEDYVDNAILNGAW